jgi:D-alanine-D-alanine ligase-like ATP-grasp enzyme
MRLFPPPSDCTFCGNAPVHHRLHYLISGVDIILSNLSPFASSKKSWVARVHRSKPVRVLAHLFFSILSVLGLLRFSSDPSLVRSARSKSIWREATLRGVRIEQMLALGIQGEEMRALLPSKKGGKKLGWEYFESIPVPPWLESEAGAWIDDKNIFKRVFEKEHLPVARGRFVTRRAQALRAFRELRKPVITKPRSGSRARHTTVNIQTEEQLLEGFRRAKELCPYVMIEECISGNLYRATCVNRKVIGIIQFVKPETVADGKKTVLELLADHNTHKKFPTLTDVKQDEWFLDAILHQGFTTSSVPPAGTHVLLSEHSERPNGGYFIDITDTVPSATIVEIERAAEVCDVEIVGFDIISPNLLKQDSSFTFIEGNTLPYIEIHDIPYEGKPRNVASAVLDMWF